MTTSSLAMPGRAIFINNKRINYGFYSHHITFNPHAQGAKSADKALQRPFNKRSMDAR
jgi:hypothetical protein